ncbi:hypothetical protein DSO57_1024435 [Entomophthora muscae]|uniref:Uncharacterized protein n=1 Tax=Entomophthora muscae TaxID=34485 RepID=A0ACC2UMX9_9FUNG|nr:hypothetical protein DSO57_1024435 [Entomophthora muscae]
MLVILLAGGVHATLYGAYNVTTHPYEELAARGKLDLTYCEYKDSEMILSRVTAVENLVLSECGACLEVMSGRKFEFVMAVDHGGLGLDLNTSTFKKLFNDHTGVYHAKWKPADPEKCRGVFKGDPSRAPGAKPSHYVKPPPAAEVVPAIAKHLKHPPIHRQPPFTKHPSPKLFH